jgi:hypothetical protein
MPSTLLNVLGVLFLGPTRVMPQAQGEISHRLSSVKLAISLSHTEELASSPN